LQAKKIELKRREREYAKQETKLNLDMIHFEKVKKSKVNHILKDLVSSQMVFFARGLELFSEAYTNLDEAKDLVLPSVLEDAQASLDAADVATEMKRVSKLAKLTRAGTAAAGPPRPTPPSATNQHPMSTTQSQRESATSLLPDSCNALGSHWHCHGFRTSRLALLANQLTPHFLFPPPSIIPVWQIFRQ
jgi:hypothetical protein